MLFAVLVVLNALHMCPLYIDHLVRLLFNHILIRISGKHGEKYLNSWAARVKGIGVSSTKLSRTLKK